MPAIFELEDKEIDEMYKMRVFGLLPAHLNTYKVYENDEDEQNQQNTLTTKNEPYAEVTQE